MSGVEEQRALWAFLSWEETQSSRLQEKAKCTRAAPSVRQELLSLLRLPFPGDLSGVAKMQMLSLCPCACNKYPSFSTQGASSPNAEWPLTLMPARLWKGLWGFHTWKNLPASSLFWNFWNMARECRTESFKVIDSKLKNPKLHIIDAKANKLSRSNHCMSAGLNFSPQILQEGWHQWKRPNPSIGAKLSPGREQDETKSTSVHCDKSAKTVSYFSHYWVILTSGHGRHLVPGFFVCWLIQCRFSRYRNLSKQRRKGQEFNEPMLIVKPHFSCFAVHKDNC